jgi:hypothetical protein
VNRTRQSPARDSAVETGGVGTGRPMRGVGPGTWAGSSSVARVPRAPQGTPRSSSDVCRELVRVQAPFRLRACDRIVY